ncbi:histidine kinase [uncultured Tenacibaculum sp.]|uniref:sensor histidine kinase n=1 Tax=uncultured Tenacibaculum sp. TaxID=174713 RepID=UPI00262FF9C7|nr:histidine kinase [uncultured Tenacibaculum sp.]
MKSIYKHVFYWVLYGLLLYILFEYVIEARDSVVHSVTFWMFQFLAFYLNYKVLIPVLFKAKQYLLFSFLNFVLIAVGSFGNTIIEDGLPENGYYAFETLMAHSAPIFIGVFTAFIFYNYYEQLKNEKKEKERITAEKDFLIQQINPHFLFNTLNNIYSLTRDNNPKGSEAVLQLSKMLDYSLYGNKKEYVPLMDEVRYITNFIDLFKLKDEEINNVSFDYKNIDVQSRIAPMLLLPFVENAFKHGNIEDLNSGKIDIEISSTYDEIRFLCVNSYNENKRVDATGGIGVKNVSRRLALLYPNRHQLDITNIEGAYKVSLKITTNGI